MTLGLEFFAIRVRMLVLRQLLLPYLGQWRHDRAPFSAWDRVKAAVASWTGAAPTPEQRTLFRRDAPRLLETEVMATTLATLGHLTAGAGMVLGLWQLVGVGLDAHAARQAVVWLSVRQGLGPAAGVHAFLAAAAQHALPRRTLAVVGSTDTHVGACESLLVWLRAHGFPHGAEESAVIDAALAAWRLAPSAPVGRWVAQSLRCLARIDARVAARDLTAHVVLNPRDVPKLVLTQEANLDPALFFNAKLLKHALRWHWQRVGEPAAIM